MNIGHRYFDLFVEPMKRWFPQRVIFWRPDNRDGWWARREKPLGYWLGHIVGYILIAVLLWAIWHVLLK